MFNKTVGHLMTVRIETCPARTRFLLCTDKMIKQRRSQLYQELSKMSRSKALRPTSPGTSVIGMTKPYSNMYMHYHFTDVEQEHANSLQGSLR